MENGPFPNAQILLHWCATCLQRSIASIHHLSLTAQSAFIGLGTFLVTGVAASVSIGTSLTVLKPKTWGDQGKSCVHLHLCHTTMELMCAITAPLRGDINIFFWF